MQMSYNRLKINDSANQSEGVKIMSIMKSILGLGAAAGAALFTLKVAQRYEDNRLAEAEQAASGAQPTQEPARTVFGDIARAASDVICDAGQLVREALTGSDEEEEDEWEVFPDGIDAEDFVQANEAEILAGAVSCDEADEEPEAFEAEEDEAPAADEEADEAADAQDDDLLKHVQQAVEDGLEEIEPEEDPETAE